MNIFITNYGYIAMVLRHHPFLLIMSASSSVPRYHLYVFKCMYFLCELWTLLILKLKVLGSQLSDFTTFMGRIYSRKVDDLLCNKYNYFMFWLQRILGIQVYGSLPDKSNILLMIYNQIFWASSFNWNIIIVKNIHKQKIKVDEKIQLWADIYSPSWSCAWDLSFQCLSPR